MTDTALTPHESRFASAPIVDKTEAFRRASRHSTNVKRLRRLILFGALALCVGVVVFAFYNPFRAVIPAGVSIEGAGLSGTKVTMARPKMSGYRSDGRPYDFTAKTAVQDIKAPNVLELNELDAHVTMSDKGVAHVTADTGIYDTSKEIMDLKGNVRIVSDTGYDIAMRSAHIEFQGGNLASQEPVSVVMKTGSVDSDTMRMTGNGTQITFEGHVRSVMLPVPGSGGPQGPPPAIKGTAQ